MSGISDGLTPEALERLQAYLAERGLNLDEILVPRDPDAPPLQFKDIMPSQAVDALRADQPHAHDEALHGTGPGQHLHEGADQINKLVRWTDLPESPTGENVTDPRLWDDIPSEVVHIPAQAITMFGRYLRQRCLWCGTILLDYDLARIAVPEGQDPNPATWNTGILVMVDGNMSAEVEPRVTDEGVQLPPSACAFSPTTQYGMERPV